MPAGVRPTPPFTLADGYHWHLIIDLHTGRPAQGYFGHEWTRLEHPGPLGNLHNHRWDPDALRDAGRGLGLRGRKLERFVADFTGRLSAGRCWPTEPGRPQLDEELALLSVHPELRPSRMRDL